MARWMAMGVLLAMACEDRVTAGDGGSSSGTPASSTSDDENDDDSASGQADTSTSIDASSTTAPNDACADGDPEECPEGCVSAMAWRIDDDACTANPIDVCVAIGDAVSVAPTTFWADGPDGPRFVEAGADCGIDPAPGDGWTECSGSADEPPDCACFCTQGVCQGDADHDLLESCGLPEPCPEVAYSELRGGSDDAATTCVLEALRDRVAGAYAFFGYSGFGGVRSRVYVDDAAVYRIVGESGKGTQCPAVGEWRTSTACELAPSEYFADCLDLVGTPDDCVAMFATWVVDCVPAAPSCPE